MIKIVFTSLCVLFSLVVLAQPDNDDPCNAIPLGVEANCISVNADNIGATDTNIPDPSCGGYNGEDVWFVVLVPANGVVQISMGSGTLSNMDFAVYSAPNCSGPFSEVNCSSGGGMQAASISGQTPGSYLFIRVFDNYSAGVFGIGADPLEQGTFTICAEAGDPPVSTGGSTGSGSYGCGNTPAAGNTCATATPICTFDGYCGSTAGYSADYWSSGSNGLGGATNAAGVFCGSIENNSFISFIAGASTVELEVDVSGGTSCSDGVQFMMFGQPSGITDPVCQSNSIVSFGCESPMAPGTNTFEGNNLTPGQEYYLMVDGFAGDVCDYEISAISGVLVEMTAGADQTICLGQSVELTVYGAGNTGTITWTGPHLNTNTGETVISTPPSPGTYQYVVEAPTISPACTGQATDMDTVLVTVVNSTTITADTSSCVNGETTLSAMGGTNYTWSPVGSLDQSTGGSVVASPVVQTTYTVTGTDANGCPVQTNLTVDPCDVPCDTPIVSYPNVICVGNIGTPNVDLPGGSYSFTTPPVDGATIDANTGAIYNTTDGTTYQITYIYTNYCNVVEVFTTATGGPACGPSVCYNGTNLVASGGNGTFTWYEEVTTTNSSIILSEADCIACSGATPSYFFGVYTGCDQTTCSTTTTSWNQFATGSSTPPPANFPIKVEDGFGGVVTYNSLADIPPCAGCTPPNLVVDDQTACDPATVDLNYSINAASDPGNANFYTNPGDANSGTNSISNIVSTTGTYYIRLEDPTDPSCFTVSSVDVTMMPTYSVSEDISTCANSTLTYPDGSTAVVTGNTSYVSNLTTVLGCDSVVTTNVTVAAALTSTENITLCSGSTHTYPDGTVSTNITVDESHTSTLTSAAGCDSIVETFVTITAAITSDEFVSLCVGSDYTYPDGTTSTNIIVDESHISTLTSTAGCDSIVETFITITSTINVTEDFVICSGTDYTYPDGTQSTNITANESHVSNFVTAGGCDSIITTNIIVTTTLSTDEYITICSGMDFTYPDGTTSTNITSDENHTSLFTSSIGCDSIVNTFVSVSSNFSSTETLVVCEGTNVIYPDGTSEVVTLTTTHFSTLVAVSGCDSIISTIVNVSPNYQSSETITICQNSMITFPDGLSVNVTTDTAHTSQLTTVSGCDSLITTNVAVSTSLTTTIDVLICYGDDYTYPDGSVSSNIIANETNTSLFTSISGCDSTVITNIEVAIIPTTTEFIVSCLNQPYTFPDGSILQVTGPMTYTSTLSSIQGCDSTIITQVNISPIYTDTVIISLCQGSNYTYPDGTVVQNIQNSLSHTSFFSTSLGCDSTIVTNISILNNYSSTEADAVCQGADYIFPDGNVITINSNTTYTSLFTSQYGCDSIIITTVDAIIAPTSDFVYSPIEPNSYNNQIDLSNQSFGGVLFEWTITTSDGTLYTSADVNTSWTIPDNFDGDISICLEATDFDGCTSSTCETVAFEPIISVYIPNTFTPDGDGKNDEFYPVINGLDPLEYEFMIFNRWGQVIYNSTFYGETWNGTYQSQPVQQDAYVYKLRFKAGGSNRYREYKGHVNVIR